MRAPNTAESLSPFPNTETANQIHLPVSPETTSPRTYGRVVGRATVAFTAAASLASLGGAAASHEAAHNNIEQSRASATTASNHRLDNATRIAYASQDIYAGGPITIQTPRRTQTKREPSTTESDAVAVAKIMGIPAANITQGKHAEVSIGGRKIDLADYATDKRTADPWTNARTGDCLWNYGAGDLGMAALKAGATPEQTKTVMHDPKKIQRVVDAYLDENPELKKDSRHYLQDGVEYKAKHARDTADELVAAMRAAAQSPDTKPAPPAKAPQAAKPNPDLKTPVHAAPHVADKTGFKEVAVKATKILSGSLLALGALVGAAGGILAFRRRRRNRLEQIATEADDSGKHRSPDPGGGEPIPDTAGDMDELRRLTKEDQERGHDPFGKSTGAHAHGNSPDKSPFAPPVETARAAPLPIAPTAPPDIRARFGAPRLLERPIDRRHLRSVRANQDDTVASIQKAFAVAQTAPEVNIRDAKTDPNAAPVIPLNGRRPLEGGGKQPDGSYIGMHRKLTYDEPIGDPSSPISAIKIHHTGDLSDRTVPVKAVS